jgi:hypothetical protein
MFVGKVTYIVADLFSVSGATNGVKLLTLPEHICSSPVFSMVRVTKS